MDDYFFNVAPECFIISDFNGTIRYANEKSRQLFGHIIDKENNLKKLNFVDSTEQNIFEDQLEKRYFEFNFDNREISYQNSNGFTLYFLLSAIKIEIEQTPCIFLSFKNITDFVGYKNIFEDLYNNLSTKTLELDKVIKEKEEAYRILKQKDQEILRELKLAEEIQINLFPDVNMKYKNYEIASTLKSASLVSGDFFSIWMPEEKYINVLIADVTGHGIPAAFITMQLKMLLQTTIKQYNSPQDIVKKLNAELYTILSNAAIFVTLLLAQIEIKNGKIQVINCGHPAPIIIRENNQMEKPEVKGMMLGITEEIEFANLKLQIHKNDTIIFLTDGILEAHNVNKVFFENNFYESLKEFHQFSPQKFNQSIFSRIKKFTGLDYLQDDSTIICIKKT